jgi:hypothetical protein
MLLQLAHSQIFARLSRLRGTTTSLRPLVFSTLQIIDVTGLSKRVSPGYNRSNSDIATKIIRWQATFSHTGAGQDSCKSGHEEQLRAEVQTFWPLFDQNNFNVLICVLV